MRRRPDYPPALGTWLRDTIGLGPGRRVLDLGAGTGKFAPLLLATGAEVIAVEPVAAMRDRLAAAYPAVTVHEGSAKTIPLADASLDALICAQSFHWFANATALREMARVLRPGGRLGLVRNQRDATIGWVAHLGELVARYEGDAPRAHRGGWKAAFPAEGFGPLLRADFAFGHSGPAEDVIVARVLSTSFIAALDPAARDAVAAEVRTLIAGEPALAGETSVTVPYRTEAYSAVRL
ncbi:class I SAM-dependent methyltransferase [Bosea sp. TWI1241]|uniref:class I SAM-dependent methyltransferase n=1 Tax=Bosea sp. TWI1241 TaxID=3148904 RepID=UPI003208BF2C